MGQDTSGGKQDARRQISAGQFEAAIGTLREQLAHNPADAEIHAMLGAAISMNGDPAGSLRHLEEAAFLDPGRAAYQYNLGYAHEREGNSEAARGAYERARRIDPHYARAVESLSRLRTGPVAGVRDSAEPETPVTSAPPAAAIVPVDPTISVEPPVEVAPVFAPTHVPPAVEAIPDPFFEPDPPLLAMIDDVPAPVMGGSMIPAVQKPIAIREPAEAAILEPELSSESVGVIEQDGTVVPAEGGVREAEVLKVPPSSVEMPAIVRAFRAINILWMIVGLVMVAFGLSAIVHPAALSLGRFHLHPITILLFGAILFILNGLSFVGAGRRARGAWNLGFVVGLLGLVGGPFGFALWAYVLGKWFLPETKAWFQMRGSNL